MKSLIAFFTVAVIAYAQNEQTCKANEEFKECGTACEPSCAQPKPEFCTMQCVRGCQCKAGFYRNKQKQCVSLSACPQGGRSRPTRSPVGGCSVIKCKAGFVCEESPIMCLRPGCPPRRGRCVPAPTTDRVTRSTNPCAITLCPPGQTCELQQVQCFTTPCDPIPVCKGAALQ